MELQGIINAAADDADKFLGDVSTKKEAQPAIRDYLKEHHPDLSPPDVMRVSAGLMALLDREGFFEGGVGGGADPWSEQTNGVVPGGA